MVIVYLLYTTVGEVKAMAVGIGVYIFHSKLFPQNTYFIYCYRLWGLRNITRVDRPRTRYTMTIMLFQILTHIHNFLGRYMVHIISMA